jgi:NAD(P)H dehydrogenase (quinone)
VAIAEGELDVLSDTVEKIAGHEPIGLERWLREHPESWRKLAEG